MEVIKYEDAVKIVGQNLDRINGVREGTMEGVAEIWLADVQKIEVEKDDWCPLKDVPGNNHEKFTEDEKWRISDIFQSYYCMGIGEIAEESKMCKNIFRKVGLIDG